MKTYPELIIPKDIEKILNEDNLNLFEIEEPKIPEKKGNNYNFKLIALLLSFIFILLKAGLGIIGIIATIVWIIKNPEKKEYEKELKNYHTKSKKYEHKKKLLKEIDNLSLEEKKDWHRAIRLRNILRKTLKPSKYEDYKKGLSHNHFKNILEKYFTSILKEDMSFMSYEFKNVVSKHNSYKPYVADFMIYDENTNLKIIIEIDEPYTFSGEPIHYNDIERNVFFTNHSAIIIRFSEEQIVKDGNKCALYVFKIYKAISDFPLSKNALNITPECISTEKWNYNKSKEMISIKFRENYLKNTGLLYKNKN